MSTRSRRSAAGSDNGINPAMIHLLPAQRLKEELLKLGLDATGTKNTLADRLQQYFDTGAAESSSVVEVAVSARRSAGSRGGRCGRVGKTKPDDRNSDVTEVKEEDVFDDEQHSPSSSPEKKVRRSSTTSSKHKSQSIKTEPGAGTDAEHNSIDESIAVLTSSTISDPVEDKSVPPTPTATVPLTKKRKAAKAVKAELNEILPLAAEPLATPQSAKRYRLSRGLEPPRAAKIDPTPLMDTDSDDEVPLLLRISANSCAPNVYVEPPSFSQNLESSHRTRSKTRHEGPEPTPTLLQPLLAEDLCEIEESGDVAPCSSSRDDHEIDYEDKKSFMPVDEENVVPAKKHLEVKKAFIDNFSSTANKSEKSSKPVPDKLRCRAAASDKKPSTELWAKKLAELKKAKEKAPDGESRKASFSKEVSVKSESIDYKKDGREKEMVPKRQALGVKTPSERGSASSLDLLGSIMSDQERLVGEARRKEQEEERERERNRIADEQRRRNALMGITPSSTSSPATSSTSRDSPSTSTPGSTSNSTPSVVLPPPPPPPPPKKLTLTTTTPTLANSPLMSDDTKRTRSVAVPPPPPPKKKSMPVERKEFIGCERKPVEASPFSSPRLIPPPPPPPKKKLITEEKTAKVVSPPPPPPPVKMSVCDETPVCSQTEIKEEISDEPIDTREEAPLSQEDIETIDNSSLLILADTADVAEAHAREEQERIALVGLGEALVAAMKLKEISDDVEVCVEEIVDQVCSEEKHKNLHHRRSVLIAEAAHDDNPEEYDPMECSTVEVFDEYVPSAVGLGNCPEGREDEFDYASDGEIRASNENSPFIEADLNESSVDGLDRNECDESIDEDALKENEGQQKMLQRFNDILEKFNQPKINEGPQYSQMPLAEDFEPEVAEKAEPDYHGEPVPSDDDDLFEQAAGISKPKKKKDLVIEEEKLPSDETIEPDYYNADLHVKGAANKNWLIEPENADGLALMWGGVKSNYGIKVPFRDVRGEKLIGESAYAAAADEEGNVRDRIVFQIKIVEFLSTKHLPFEEMDPHDVRIGFSLRSSPNILGEFPHSYCITSLGKKASFNFFTDFGEPFHQNDIITACIDFSTASISYWKNDQFLGVAFENIRLPDESANEAIYPHICVKNCSVSVNFGDFPGGKEEWITNPEWRFFSTLGRGDLERSPKAPDSKADCTVLMMVGMPGVGKTTWVRNYLHDNHTENWTVIQSEIIMSAMKVNGIPRQRAHQGRWDMVLGLIGKSLQRCVLLAARRRRNYILDMTNVSRDARKRRLILFEEFRRKCVIIIPSDEDMLDRQARQARQEGIAMMPPEAILEMKAVMSIPDPEHEPIDGADIYFIEPRPDRIQDAIDIVARYNEEARPWFQKKYRRRRSQMIGLGPDVRDRDMQNTKKFSSPLTVLPPLRVNITPMTEVTTREVNSAASTPITPGITHRSSFSSESSQQASPATTPGLPQSNSNQPQSAGLDQDKSSSSKPVVVQEPPVISVTTQIDKLGSRSHNTPTVRPTVTFNNTPAVLGSSLVRVNIQDIPEKRKVVPSTSTSLDDIQLDEDEIREVRESSKISGGDPKIAEAVMRAKCRALQVKKKEKLDAMKACTQFPIPGPSLSSSSSAVPFSSRLHVETAPSRIPTIGATTPISITNDTSIARPSSMAAPALHSPMITASQTTPVVPFPPNFSVPPSPANIPVLGYQSFPGSTQYPAPPVIASPNVPVAPYAPYSVPPPVPPMFSRPPPMVGVNPLHMQFTTPPPAPGPGPVVWPQQPR